MEVETASIMIGHRRRWVVEVVVCGVGLLLVVVGCCEVGSVLDVRRSTDVTSGKITKEFFLPREVSFFYRLLGENGWVSGSAKNQNLL